MGIGAVGLLMAINKICVLWAGSYWVVLFRREDHGLRK